jgi:osmotically-inducible protein OsmY
MYVNTSSISTMIGAMLLLGGMAGCTFFHEVHQCGVAECPSDAKITADVEARFQEHSSTQPPNTIYVSTFKGVVYLSGDVDSPTAKAEAESVARKTPGVTDVVNSIVGRQTP